MSAFDALPLKPAANELELLAPKVKDGLLASDFHMSAYVCEIDPALADTQALNDAFGLAPEVSANCVIVSGKREGVETIAACLVLASTKADVNSFVRKHLNLRKVSFHPMDRAVTETEMEYGGITPIGLPPEWPLLIDARVVDTEQVIIGSGVRKSKLIVPGAALGTLPNASVLQGLAV